MRQRPAVIALIALPLLLVLGQLLAPSPEVASAVSGVLLLVAAGWAGAALALRARAMWLRTPARRRIRTPALFAAYCFVWMVGKSLWLFSDLFVQRDSPAFSWVDAASLAAVLLAIAGALQLLAGSAGVVKLRVLLDALLVGLALLFASWPFVLGPIIRDGASRVEVLLGAAYPFADAALITVLATAWPALPAALRRAGGQLLAGLVCIGVADSMHVYLAATEGFWTGTLVDLGWVLGFALIALAAASAPSEVREPGPGWAAGARLPLVALYVSVLPGVAVVGWFTVAGRAPDPEMIWIGLATLLVLVSRQIATVVESEQRAQALSHQVSHDALTGLWNRGRFIEHLAAGLRESREPRAVLVVDVDNFKDVNDNLSHPAGNQVLRCLARRLCGSLRSSDVVARLEANEFGLVLQPFGSATQAVRLAERVRNAASAPVVLDGLQHSLSVSVGVALSPEHGDTAEELVRNAQLATYDAKRHGRNRCVMYSPSLDDEMVERIRMAAELETALARNEFLLHYQPKYDLNSGALAGAEALLRWQHPTRGLLSPERFVTVAHQTGLLVQIDRWALENACRFISRLRSEELVSATFEICVNVSPVDLRRPDFVDHVARCLARTSLQPHQLIVEITESVLVDADSALPILRDLKDLGVLIALDDFGTGYSSLSYLDRFPVDIVKIDRSFVEDIDRRPTRKAMVQAITGLTSTLRLTTTAEGIERESQLTTVREAGCDRGQGYYLSPPLTEAALVALLARTQQGSRVWDVEGV